MIRDLITLVEEKSKDELALHSLPYKKTELDPIMSKRTLDYHYSKLAAGYVKRYNAGEGDSDFNEAGAYLHNLFFPQLQSPTGRNVPKGTCEILINKKYGSFDLFKKEFAKVAMGIQGSGWVYLSRSGDIKTITNHQIKKDVAMIVDWWEHSWALDYEADKAGYLTNMWKIINWEVVNSRL